MDKCSGGHLQAHLRAFGEVGCAVKLLGSSNDGNAESVASAAPGEVSAVISVETPHPSPQTQDATD